MQGDENMIFRYCMYSKIGSRKLMPLIGVKPKLVRNLKDSAHQK